MGGKAERPSIASADRSTAMSPVMSTSSPWRPDRAARRQPCRIGSAPPERSAGMLTTRRSSRDLSGDWSVAVGCPGRGCGGVQKRRTKDAGTSSPYRRSGVAYVRMLATPHTGGVLRPDEVTMYTDQRISRLDLVSLVNAPDLAALHARDVLRTWNWPGALDVAWLVIVELVTCAVARPVPIPQMLNHPLLREARPLRLTLRWSYDFPPQGGKVVWCDLPARPELGSAPPTQQPRPLESGHGQGYAQVPQSGSWPAPRPPLQPLPTEPPGDGRLGMPGYPQPIPGYPRR